MVAAFIGLIACLLIQAPAAVQDDSTAALVQMAVRSDATPNSNVSLGSAPWDWMAMKFTSRETKRKQLWQKLEKKFEDLPPEKCDETKEKAEEKLYDTKKKIVVFIAKEVIKEVVKIDGQDVGKKILEMTGKGTKANEVYDEANEVKEAKEAFDSIGSDAVYKKAKDLVTIYNGLYVIALMGAGAADLLGCAGLCTSTLLHFTGVTEVAKGTIKALKLGLSAMCLIEDAANAERALNFLKHKCLLQKYPGLQHKDNVPSMNNKALTSTWVKIFEREGIMEPKPFELTREKNYLGGMEEWTAMQAAAEESNLLDEDNDGVISKEEAGCKGWNIMEGPPPGCERYEDYDGASSF